jgi:hypothetical protein
VLDLGLLISNSQFLPLDLGYITTPRIFLDPLMVLQVPGRIVHRFPLHSFYLLVFSAGQIVSRYFGQQCLVLRIFWTAVSCVTYILDSSVLCYVYFGQQCLVLRIFCFSINFFLQRLFGFPSVIFSF